MSWLCTTRAGPNTQTIRKSTQAPHLDVVDVLVAVRLLPQLLHNLVDVCHFGGVERQQRLLQRLQSAKQRERAGWEAGERQQVERQRRLLKSLRRHTRRREREGGWETGEEEVWSNNSALSCTCQQCQGSGQKAGWRRETDSVLRSHSKQQRLQSRRLQSRPAGKVQPPKMQWQHVPQPTLWYLSTVAVAVKVANLIPPTPRKPQQTTTELQLILWYFSRSLWAAQPNPVLTAFKQ